MTDAGPPLETLTRRLAETPPDFLLEPEIGGVGAVNAAAVVADLLAALGAPPLTAAEARAFRSTDPADRNLLRLTLIAAWLLHAAWFRQQGGLAGPARNFLKHDLPRLAQLIPAEKFVTDSERREELARYALARLGLRPAGESAAEAEDRWRTVSSVERQRVVAAAQAAEARAREVREAMARQAAYDAQAKAMRE